MKNKLGVNFFTSEKFASDLSVHDMEGQRAPKPGARREPVAPKIVICPPVEDKPEQTNQARGRSLLKALSRRLSRRNDSYSSSNSTSSSNESVSGDQNRSEDHTSCSASDSSSDGSEPQRRYRSSVSLRRVLQSLTLSSRSQSCSRTERSRPPKKQQQPQRILRPPVTYTYVRGLSGLPTQRVPRHTVCCSTPGLSR